MDVARTTHTTSPLAARPVSLGDVLRRRREDLGFTAPEAGDLLGVSSGTITRWERDETIPRNGDHIVGLMAFLGVDETSFGEATFGLLFLRAHLSRRSRHR
jgi:transcriptional regulator with XRE-family HTH domain